MNAPHIPTPEAGDTSGEKSPSSSPRARESASKRRERSVANIGDTLTPGDKIPSQKLANASCAPAVTEDVAESLEGGAKPLTWPAERPPWWPEGTVYAPGLFQRMGIPFTPSVTRASAAHLEPVGQHELGDDAKIPEFLRRQGVGAVRVTPPVTRASGAHLEPFDDDAKIPEFLRRQGVTSLATHAQPIASDREPSEGSQADQPSGFVRRILREAGLVTFPVTPSQAPPASVTPTLTAAPVAGSVCPTCRCRVPARLTPAERQRAYRARQRKQRKPVIP
jgi:hypothetical protein